MPSADLDEHDLENPPTEARPKKKKPNDLDAFLDMDMIAILVTVLMQDGPFLLLRYGVGFLLTRVLPWARKIGNMPR